MATKITGANELTIAATANAVYEIEFETATAVDIFNDTAGDLYINSSGTFTTTDGVSNYLLLAEGTSYNGYRPPITLSTSVFIKTTAAGNICVTVKGY